MALVKLVLVLILTIAEISFVVLTRSVDKQNIPGWLVLFKNQNAGWDACPIKQVCRKSYYRIQQILLNNSLTDTPFRGAAKQNPLRNNRRPAPVAPQGIKNVSILDRRK